MASPPVNASCGAVVEASCRFHRGVVVPIPTFPELLLKIAVDGLVDVAHLELAPVGHVLRQVSPVRQSSVAESAVVDAYGSRDAVVEVATM